MRVLISGAGIAGPALAHWLHRHGIETTVVERARGPRPGGHAVDVRGAARAVVESMGLMPTVRAATVDERGIAFVNRAGRRTAAMPADLFGGESIVAEIEIARGDLARILYDDTAPYTDYRFGDRITALRQDETGVDVDFLHSAGRYDLVVGADGVHSAVRALAFGPDDAFVEFLGAYTAYFTVPDPGDLDHWFEMYNAPGGLVAGLRPERGGTAKASLSFTAPSPMYERASVEQQQEALRSRLAGAGWRVPSMLAAMPSAPDFYFDSINRVTVESWSRGRVVLIGDAGYCGSPLAGLGTSMSLVGAYVLAGELAAAMSAPATAFAAYQREMAAYVAAGLELPPGGVKGYAPQSALMIRLRSLSMRMMNHWPMRQMIAKQAGKADAITLKEYPAVRSVPGGGSPTS